jgi:hypothetical protein
MSISPEPIDTVTVPCELNAVPWTDSEGKREFSRLLEEALTDDELLFQDAAPTKLTFGT